jgi:uncharacterized protein (TIGR03086 family)
MSDVISNHRRACSGFTLVVAQGEGRWTDPSPCPEWDARGVVEHVIGFHDELLLHPTGIKPMREEDDPIARWEVTIAAIDSAIEVASSKSPEDPPLPPAVDLDQLLPALTAEVLAHSWDLATALGVDPRLEAELCQVAYDFMRRNEEQIRSSGMFGSTVSVPQGADGATQLIAFLGRDPGWAL